MITYFVAFICKLCRPLTISVLPDIIPGIRKDIPGTVLTKSLFIAETPFFKKNFYTSCPVIS